MREFKSLSLRQFAYIRTLYVYRTGFVFVFRIPDIVVDGFIRFTYEHTAGTLNAGHVMKGEQVVHLGNGETRINHLNSFIKKSENLVCHIRPKGQDFIHSQKPIPVTDDFGRNTYAAQCLWLDNAFIKAIIDDRSEEYLKEAEEHMRRQGMDIRHK